MANSQVFAPTRRVKSQTDVSRRFHADRATVVLPPFELSTGELPPVRQSRLLGGGRSCKARWVSDLRKKARSPCGWAPGRCPRLKRVKRAPLPAQRVANERARFSRHFE